MATPRATAAVNTVTSSNNAYACPTCRGAGWLRLDVSIDDPRFGQMIPCACKAKEIEEKKMRTLLEHSNLQALQDKTLDKFFPNDEQQNAYNQARRFAENPEGWLVLLGSYGSGKTHLAAAIGNRRLELGEPAVFIVVPDLLDHLRAAFSPESEITFDDLFESVRNAPLLILDDLGTQTTTAWANEKMFQILNHRYMMKLPTVITTNVPLDHLGDRLASRMVDGELSSVVAIDAADLRAARDRPTRDAPPPSRTRSSRGSRTYRD